MEPKLTRPKEGRIIAGVCQGLADYFKIDPVIVRVIFIIMALGKGAGILIYIVLLIAMPEAEGDNAADDKSEYSASNGPAKTKQVIKDTAQEIRKLAKDNNRATEIIAATLIILGGIFLLNNLAPAFFALDKVWPLILVVIGLAILLGNRKAAK